MTERSHKEDIEAGGKLSFNNQGSMENMEPALITDDQLHVEASAGSGVTSDLLPLFLVLWNSVVDYLSVTT